MKNTTVCLICSEGSREMYCPIPGDYICDSCCQKFQLHVLEDGWQQFLDAGAVDRTHPEVEETCLTCPNLCRYDEGMNIVHSPVRKQTMSFRKDQHIIPYINLKNEKYYYVFSDKKKQALLKFEALLTKLDIPAEERAVELAKKTYYTMEMPEEALRQLEKQSGNGLAYTLLKAQLHRELNHRDLAVSHYEKALAFQPTPEELNHIVNPDEIHSFLSQAYADKMRKETDPFRKAEWAKKAAYYMKKTSSREWVINARENLFIFRPSEKDNPHSAYFDIAKLYVESADYTRAIIELNQVVDMLPKTTDLLSHTFLKGKIWGEEKIYIEDAHHYFKTVAIQTRLLLAQCYALLGHPEKALGHVEDVLYLDPNHPDAVRFHHELLTSPEQNHGLLKKWMSDSFSQLERTLHQNTKQIQDSIDMFKEELTHKLSDQQAYYEQLIQETNQLLKDHHIETSEVVGLTLEEVREMKQDLNRFMGALRELQQFRAQNQATHPDPDEFFTIIAEKFETQVENYLGSFSARKEVYERKLEREFGQYWDLLAEESKRFLITSEVIFHSYRHFEGIDFSPAVIPLTKAIERELHEKLFEPLRKYCDAKYPTPPTPDEVKNHFPKGLYYFKWNQSYPVETPTLGTFVELVGRREKSGKLIQDAGFTKPGTLNNTEVLLAFHSTLKKIKELRNDVCHKHEVRIDNARELRNLIVWEKKLLKDFLSYLKTSNIGSASEPIHT